jgi:glycosyltransferase involved in cell wall biosynthesis
MGGRRRSRSSTPTRLGIYVDDVYSVQQSNGTARITTDRAFLLFACEVGRSFDSLTLLGRTLHERPPLDYVLPTGIELAELPYYGDLRAGMVVRVFAGTISTTWRALGRVDVIWVFGPHPIGLLMAALALARGKRVVLGVRGEGVAYFKSRMSERRVLVLGAVVTMDHVHRLLSRVLPTTVVSADLAEEYERGSAPVLPMTVSLVGPQDLATAPRSDDWSGPIELLTVGRIDAEKNPLLLVEMMARLDRDEPGRYRLHVVGRGALTDAVQRRAVECGVADRIVFDGYIPFGPELLDRYRRAHLFVHVSLTEGLPQVLVEALATATPIVATDVGGVRGALDDGRAGLLVPPRDAGALVSAVRRLCATPELRTALVTRGLELAASLTIEREAARVARFLRAPQTSMESVPS